MSVWATNKKKNISWIVFLNSFVSSVTKLLKLRLSKLVYSFCLFVFKFWINLLFGKGFFEVIWKNGAFWTVHLLLEYDSVLPIRQKWGSHFCFSQSLFLVRPDCFLGCLYYPCTETWCGGAPFPHSLRISQWRLWGWVSNMINVPLACFLLLPVWEQC